MSLSVGRFVKRWNRLVNVLNRPTLVRCAGPTTRRSSRNANNNNDADDENDDHPVYLHRGRRYLSFALLSRLVAPKNRRRSRHRRPGSTVGTLSTTGRSAPADEDDREDGGSHGNDAVFRCLVSSSSSSGSGRDDDDDDDDDGSLLGCHCGNDPEPMEEGDGAERTMRPRATIPREAATVTAAVVAATTSTTTTTTTTTTTVSAAAVPTTTTPGRRRSRRRRGKGVRPADDVVTREKEAARRPLDKSTQTDAPSPSSSGQLCILCVYRPRELRVRPCGHVFACRHCYDESRARSKETTRLALAALPPDTSRAARLRVMREGRHRCEICRVYTRPIYDRVYIC